MVMVNRSEVVNADIISKISQSFEPSFQSFTLTSTHSGVNPALGPFLPNLK